MPDIFPNYRLTEEKIKQFKDKIIVLENGCWDMNKAKDASGYNTVTLRKNVHFPAHRFSYQIHKGTQGMYELHVLHKCNNRFCVNPEHLYLGTPQNNTDDRYNTNTHNNKQCSNIENVEKIRELYATGNFTQTVLGRRFGLDPSAISRIVTGQRWQKYVPLVKESGVGYA